MYRRGVALMFEANACPGPRWLSSASVVQCGHIAVGLGSFLYEHHSLYQYNIGKVQTYILYLLRRTGACFHCSSRPRKFVAVPHLHRDAFVFSLLAFRVGVRLVCPRQTQHRLCVFCSVRPKCSQYLFAERCVLVAKRGQHGCTLFSG